MALAGLRPKALLALCNEPVALATAEELGAWSTKGHLLPNISGAAHVFPTLDGRDTRDILDKTGALLRLAVSVTLLVYPTGEGIVYHLMGDGLP